MDTTEIAFIICKNDALLYEECVRYIQDLYIPEGYHIDIISIEDAESITMAYNAALHSGQAKYKVYLCQDVFILNRNFIPDILKIFEENSSVGMIGMIGSKKIFSDENSCQSWDTGRAYIYNGTEMIDLDLSNIDKKEDYIFVEAIDGLVMVTQYDIRWQDEIPDEWKSYNISQSQAMRESGKRIVVPWQEEPWCYYERGNVDQECQIDANRSKGFYTQLRKIVEAGVYDVLWAIIDEIRNIKDREFGVIAALTEIYMLEKESRQGLSSIWWLSSDWKEIYNYYRWVRFVLLRMGFWREDERIETIKELVREGRLHRDAILNIADKTLFDANNVYHTLLKKKIDEPLVSVILPVYNGETHVGKTIESILCQTYKNMEIIIVDDASTDRSREVIRSYRDPRIKTIFCEKNRNIVYSGNLGFQAAKGKYIALIGHDDLWKPDKLEKQVAFLEEHPSYCVCFTYMDVIDENLRIIRDSFFYQLFSKTNRAAKAWIRKLFVEGNHFCAPSACIRKSALDKVGYYRYALVQLQDYDLWLRLFLKGEVYIYAEKLTYYRRFSDGKNLSVINTDTKIRGMHEQQYICGSYIKSLSKEKFIDVFCEDIRNAGGCEEKAILCAKAFLLWRNGIYLGLYCFSDILEDEECRQILAERYQMDLNQFYKLNTQPMPIE